MTRRGRRRSGGEVPAPHQVYAGLTFLEAEPELVEQLAASPRLLALGVFRFEERILALPDAAAAEVERELAAQGIVPRKA